MATAHWGQDEARVGKTCNHGTARRWLGLVAFEPTSEGRIPDSKYQYSLVYNIISEIYSEICSSSGSEASII